MWTAPDVFATIPMVRTVWRHVHRMYAIMKYVQYTEMDLLQQAAHLATSSLDADSRQFAAPTLRFILIPG